MYYPTPSSSTSSPTCPEPHDASTGETHCPRCGAELYQVAPDPEIVESGRPWRMILITIAVLAIFGTAVAVLLLIAGAI